ncbi:MAG: alpha-glucosidase family protein [Woeseiaceae bacterium]|nr:alpha-glucosidase family protein [Woeseiaceae bacterium]
MTSNAEWWRGAVIYQIYPRSFFDSNGDGIGDLKGITEKLDYVASLGVDGFWVSPFFTSPMKDFGYDVSDYNDVDPMFGTLEDFDAMVARAHELGLKVIIDQVYSHTSDQHAWFQESRESRDNDKAEWYVWADARYDGSPPNNWQSVFSIPAWTWDARRQQYYMHNFLSEQPDLNLHHPDVQDALLDVARFWLDRGVDGFRLDAINCGMHDPLLRDNPPAKAPDRNETRPCFMQTPKYNMCHDNMPQVLERLRAVTDQYGEVFTVAEVGAAEPLPVMKDYTYGGKRLNTAYGFEFLSTTDLTVEGVREILEGWPGEEGEGWPSWAFSNHDAPRVASRWLKDLDHSHRVRLIALLQFALRGNAFVYNGEELGLTQATVPFERLQDPEAINNWPHTMGRDGARTPMPWTNDDAPHAGFSTVEPWLPVDDEHRSMSVAAQHEDKHSTLHFFRSMIALRKSSPALQIGSLEFIDALKGVLAFKRVTDGETVLCVFNLGADEVAWSPDNASDFTVIAGVGDTVTGEKPPAMLGAYSGYIGFESDG